MGLSELVCNYFLWKALSDPAFCGVVFSKTQADTSNLAKRIKRSIFDFIATYRIHLETANLTDISILGGDRLMFMNSSPAGVRGAELVSHVLLDEHAFSESPQQIFDAMLPTLEMVGESSRVILCSTPNSRSGHFYELLNSGNASGDVNHDIDATCQQIREGCLEGFQSWVDDSGWNKILLHWQAHPVYSKVPNYLEKKATELKMSASVIQREFNLSFDDSDTAVFSHECITKEVVGRILKGDDLPENIRCHMAVDPATVGLDYFVVIVLAQFPDKLAVVAMYRKLRATMELHLDNICDLITEYNPLVIGIETNGGVGYLYHDGRTPLPCRRNRPVNLPHWPNIRGASVVHADRW